MQIIAYGVRQGTDVTRFGSVGVQFTPLTRIDQAGVALMRVAAGGEIGLHAATVDQLFVVIAGRGSVRGGEGAWHPIEAGQAALWTLGEEHATRADEAIVALVVEAPQVPVD